MKIHLNGPVNNTEFFNNIGINLKNFNDKIPGDLYCSPEDFVVGEVHSDGVVCSVTESSHKAENFNEEYIHATLVKCCISTFEACKIFCDANNMKPEDITYCGLKDTIGVTSQIICIKNRPSLNLKNLTFSDFFLKDIISSKNKLDVGSHIGNNFIIKVRNIKIPYYTCRNIIENFEKFAKNGLPNFYGPQRFGIRQNNHLLGKMLLNGDYKEFVFKFLTFTANEGADIVSIRKELENNFGDWDKCISIVNASKELPDEAELILNLRKGKDIVSSIKCMKISNFLLHSYSSYLFNMAISKFLEENYIDQQIEKIGNDSVMDDISGSVYSEIMEDEEISIDKFRKCDFQAKCHKRNTLFKPLNFGYDISENAMTLNFTLGKGEYASLLLFFLVDSNIRKLR